MSIFNFPTVEADHEAGHREDAKNLKKEIESTPEREASRNTMAIIENYSAMTFEQRAKEVDKLVVNLETNAPEEPATIRVARFALLAQLQGAGESTQSSPGGDYRTTETWVTYEQATAFLYLAHRVESGANPNQKDKDLYKIVEPLIDPDEHLPLAAGQTEGVQNEDTMMQIIRDAQTKIKNHFENQ